MSWMGGLGWKEGLSGVQMQKVTNNQILISLIKRKYYLASNEDLKGALYFKVQTSLHIRQINPRFHFLFFSSRLRSLRRA